MNEKIKFVTVLYGLAMGGAEHMAYELIKNLDHNQFDAKVICYGKKLGTPLESEMEAICQVDYLGVTGHIGIAEIITVLKHVSKCTPDILHAHMGGVTFAIPWALLHRKPLVVTVHTKPEQAFSRKNEKLLRYAIRKKNIRLVAVSEDNYVKVKQYFNVYDERVQFVNNGIDIKKFQRKPHNGFAFINVARQDENKNQAAILRAFKKLRECDDRLKLYLIGDGPAHEDLVQMTIDMELQDCVVIPGITSTPEDYYAVSDVYVQSSHREAMPLSVLEAMAAGLPIISTDVGGLRDVVKENGILVHDGSDQELIDAMQLLLSESQKDRAHREAESSRIVRKYSSQEMANRYMEIYWNLLK